MSHRTKTALSARWTCLLLGAVVGSSHAGAAPADLTAWRKHPAEFPGANVAAERATLTAAGWSFLAAPNETADAELSAVFTLRQAAQDFQFFGSSWSVWPDKTFGDGGYEAGLLLRGGEGRGYRVQISSKYQDLAVVKYPSGGYLRAVPCAVPLDKPLRLAARIQGREVVVLVDGEEKLRFRDELEPLASGRFGVGVSSRARVEVAEVRFAALPVAALPPPVAHTPRFRVRKWIGERPWVFDGDEPILLLPVPEASYINNVKLRPGYKPQLSWNSHWDIQCQGAYPEGQNKNTPVSVEGEGETLTARWKARQTQDRFETRTALRVGWNPERQTYTYDVESELEVLGKEPFHFRYGYDFEHHTPLDPFNWQYLLVRRENGELSRRPVYPIDPGTMSEVAGYRGQRVWHGRHDGERLLNPAVEYDIAPSANTAVGNALQAVKRSLNTAVCAAFYDTGVSYAAETAPPGTKVRVKYRYTGYPADEADALFQQSVSYQCPMLDPRRHYLFADEWPKLTFRQFRSLDQTWVYGRRPFVTGHNVRPTYELEQNAGAGSGFAMRLGPGAYGKAALPIPGPLAAGRYAVLALCKLENVHGPGGRIEIEAADKKGQPLAKLVHHVGQGTAAWRTVGVAFDLSQPAETLSLALGNAGSGAVLFTDVEIRPLAAGDALPQGVAAAPQPPAAPLVPAPAGAIADYRFVEGLGHHVYDFAGGLGFLELNNAAWTIDEGRPAIRLDGRRESRADHAPGGQLDLHVLSHPANQKGREASFALAGHHGGGKEYSAFTLATWVKPGEKMNPAYWGADVVGFGARRVKLLFREAEPPYTLGAALNFGDYFWTETRLEAGRWRHLAITGEATADKKWRIRLYVDGRRVHEGTSEKIAAPMLMPGSLILGAELFYLDGAYYQGLLGRTLVLERAVSEEELRKLAAESAP